MLNLIWCAVLCMLTLTACGAETPTRKNDFVPLTSIEIVAAAPSIAAKTSTRLTAIGHYSGIFTRDISDQVVFTSDAPTIAAFNNSAAPSRVKGLMPGTAILTATKGSISASSQLTVTNATLSTMTITPANPNLARGLTTQFSVSGKFSDNTTQDLTFDAAWLSSDTGVATVSDAVASKGFAQAVALGSTTVSATFDGAKADTLLTVTGPVLQSIAITPANPTLLSISGTNFKAVGTYSDGTTPDITGLVSWSSSQTGIATIAAGGIATTVAQGTSLIRADLDGVSGSTNLKVTGGNLVSFTVAPANAVMVKGTSGRITATGSFSNSTTRDISGQLTWSSSNSATVAVAVAEGNLVWLNAVDTTIGSGPTIKATYGALNASATATVLPLTLNTLTISPASGDISAGTSSRFTVSGNFSDGSTHDLTASADWTSGNSSVATVGNTGLLKGDVTGVAASTTSVAIKAAFGGLSASVPLTVRSRTLQDLTITNKSTSVVAGNQITYTATAHYSDGTSQDVTEVTSWSSDNSNIAIVADSKALPGIFLAVDSGLAKITASFGGKSQTLQLVIP